jgi:hypothetical protein
MYSIGYSRPIILNETERRHQAHLAMSERAEETGAAAGKARQEITRVIRAHREEGECNSSPTSWPWLPWLFGGYSVVIHVNKVIFWASDCSLESIPLVDNQHTALSSAAFYHHPLATLLRYCVMECLLRSERLAGKTCRRLPVARHQSEASSSD